MALVNEHFLKLPGSYLFSDIAKKVNTFKITHPKQDIIRLGIGDVTQPLPKACIEAMHKAVEELASKDTFRGYGPEQGYDFLIEADVNTPALQRLADHLMPPETITLWLDQAGELVTNAEVLMILNEDYKPKDKGGRHLNLNEERWAQISHCISAKDWRTWCNDSYNIAQRLAVEHISRDQKKIRMAVPGILDDGLEGETDGLLPLFSPGPVAVRHHPPVDVCSVNKFHG